MIKKGARIAQKMKIFLWIKGQILIGIMPVQAIRFHTIQRFMPSNQKIRTKPKIILGKGKNKKNKKKRKAVKREVDNLQDYNDLLLGN